jgi:hypothetical protein
MGILLSRADHWGVSGLFSVIDYIIMHGMEDELVYKRFIDRFLSKLHSVGVSFSNILQLALKRTRVSLLYMLLYLYSLLRVRFLSSDPPFCP